jgi:hypothetical protein
MRLAPLGPLIAARLRRAGDGGCVTWQTGNSNGRLGPFSHEGMEDLLVLLPKN